MKYIRKYNESSIPMNSELVTTYNDMKKQAMPIVEYFKSYYNSVKVESETSLDNFIERYIIFLGVKNIEYIDLTGTTYKNEIERDIINFGLDYTICIVDPTGKDIRRKITVKIKKLKSELYDINVVLDNNRNIQLIVWQFILSECRNGKKFINIINSYKKIKFGITNVKSVKGKNAISDVFKGKKADLMGIVNTLRGTADENRLLVKLSPYIFKYGEDYEVKEMWDRINILPNIMTVLNNLNKETPKIGKPDNRGFFNRLRSVIKLSDNELQAGKDMSGMGFNDD